MLSCATQEVVQNVKYVISNAMYFMKGIRSTSCVQCPVVTEIQGRVDRHPAGTLDMQESVRARSILLAALIIIEFSVLFPLYFMLMLSTLNCLCV